MPLNLRYARTPWARVWGLLGRRSYPPGQALVFERCNSIHTWFMRMPVDVIFVDAEWRVIETHEALPSWRTLRCPAAYATVELGAHQIAALAIRQGSTIV